MAKIYKSYKVKVFGRGKAKKLAQDSAARAKSRGFTGVHVECILHRDAGRPYETYATTYEKRPRKT